MKRIIKSKLAAFLALALIIAVIVLTFKLRQEWWCFIDIFFLFIASFLHIMALSMGKMGQIISSKLDKIAFYAFVLGIVAFIIEAIVFYV